MRKINLQVAAEQEAFEYLNNVEEETQPYWEVADERYNSYSYNEEFEEQEFFWKQLRDYEKKYFDGKRWEDVDPIIRDVWSDLYKDVHGIRPRHIPLGCIA